MSTRSSQRRLIIMFWPNYNMFSVFCFFFFLSEIIFGKTGHRVAFNESTTADVPF